MKKFQKLYKNEKIDSIFQNKMEDALLEKYDAHFDDLVKINSPFRDGNEHYYNRKTDEYYSYSFIGFNKGWYKPSLEYRKKLSEYIPKKDS